LIKGIFGWDLVLPIYSSSFFIYRYPIFYNGSDIIFQKTHLYIGMLLLILFHLTGFWNLSGVFLPGIYSVKMRKTCPILGFAQAKPWRKKKNMLLLRLCNEVVKKKI